jgi:nucleoside-diphosphate-sugar epimerase
MKARKHTILIAGASGVVGTAATEYFASLPDWQVLALSRRAIDLPPGVTHVPLDLCDAQACMSAGDNLRHVTHVLYAALFELPELVAGWRDPRQMATNEAMLRNLLDALQVHAKGVRHVTILQGTKAYGGHVEPAPVPAKERMPRHKHENFYWLQEDLLRTRQPHAAWTFSILRPQLVFGHAVSSPMNIVAAIGAYAAILREQGQPLHFPGGGRYINAASDSRLIAQAAHFVATHEVAANETYNVVNGDMLVWQDIWSSIAARFGMTRGDDVPLSLAHEMPLREAVWQRVVQRHDLQPLRLEQLINSSWQFTDRALAHGLEHPADSVLSPIKLHQHGFHGCMDTEDSLHDWLERMQHQRLLPR